MNIRPAEELLYKCALKKNTKKNTKKRNLGVNAKCEVHPKKLDCNILAKLLCAIVGGKNTIGHNYTCLKQHTILRIYRIEVCPWIVNTGNFSCS